MELRIASPVVQMGIGVSIGVSCISDAGTRRQFTGPNRRTGLGHELGYANGTKVSWPCECDNVWALVAMVTQ